MKTPEDLEKLLGDHLREIAGYFPDAKKVHVCISRVTEECSLTIQDGQVGQLVISAVKTRFPTGLQPGAD